MNIWQRLGFQKSAAPAAPVLEQLPAPAVDDGAEQRAASVPGVPINNDGAADIVARWMGGAGGRNEPIVTPATAMQQMGVFACVRVLAESVASLPLKLYNRSVDNAKSQNTTHALHGILHTTPNPEMSAFDYWETCMVHALLWGNHYAEIEMNGRGDVLALWPLRPDRTAPVRDINTGKLYYETRLANGDVVRLHNDKVFHVRGIGTTGLVGISPIEAARRAIGLAATAEELGLAFYANNAAPGVVLKHPGKLSDKAYNRMLNSWEQRHAGVDKAARTALLEEGTSVEAIGMPMRDAEFLASRKFQLAEIARMYRVPLHKIGELDRATFSNIEHLSIEFVVDSLRPWLVRIESAISRCLFGKIERQALYAEFLVDGLLRGDLKTRYEAYNIARQGGWMNGNDIRRRENENPIDGGDAYWRPANMVEIGAPVDAGAPAPAARSLALAPLVDDAAARIVAVEAKYANRDDLAAPGLAKYVRDVAAPLLAAAGRNVDDTAGGEIVPAILASGAAAGTPARALEIARRLQTWL